MTNKPSLNFTINYIKINIMMMNKFSFIFYSTDRAEVCFPRNNFCCTRMVTDGPAVWLVSLPLRLQGGAEKGFCMR